MTQVLKTAARLTLWTVIAGALTWATFVSEGYQLKPSALPLTPATYANHFRDTAEVLQRAAAPAGSIEQADANVPRS